MSLDVVVSSYEEEGAGRAGIARSSSAASSTPARQHYNRQQHYQHHNLHSTSSSSPAAGEARKYQYIPYSANTSSSASTQYSSQNSLTGQQQQHGSSRGGTQSSRPQAQQLGFPTQGIAVQRLPRGQHSVPSSHSYNSFQQPAERSQLSVPQSYSHNNFHQPVDRNQHGVSSSRSQNNFQQVDRSQRSVPSSRSQNNFQQVDRSQHSVHSQNNFQQPAMDRRLPESHHSNMPRQFPVQGMSIAERQARSSSLKSGVRHSVDPYAEFSDAHFQFNNHIPASYHSRHSSSSSESSPQASPHHVQRASSLAPQHLLHTTHPHQTTNHYPQQNGRSQRTSGLVHQDLHEVPELVTKQSSGSRSHGHSSDVFDSPYRSSSRNTYVKSSTHIPRRVNSNDSFSFASSIKCCVGLQSSRKKKRSSSRQIALYHAQQRQAQQKRREKENMQNAQKENWVSLSAVRSQYPQQAFHSSPSHSTVSCPYTVSNSTQSTHQQQQYKRSSGYGSELDTGSWATPWGYSSNYESDSDFSDSDFARATRGKSANSVMMKLAKKFSKKNLPITRDDEDDVSIGSDSLERGEAKLSSWKLKQRSNSVSNLDSVDG